MSISVGFGSADRVAERWVRNIGHELLDRTLIWNQHQLQRLVIDYSRHYNEDRPHRSLDRRPPLATSPIVSLPHLRVMKSTRCDGLNEYRYVA
jgi:hypothetical protein